jgi:hypothetical protein
MNKGMDIPLGEEVYCADGFARQSSHLILNPLSRRITHLVVRKGHFPHSDHAVPTPLDATLTPPTAQHPATCSYREQGNLLR